jgi:RHS repeat-associated protein
MGFDNLNHMTSARQEATDTGPTGAYTMLETFKYDVLSRRIEQDVTQNGVTTITHFAYDAYDTLFASMNSSNALLERWLSTGGPSTAFARIISGAVGWLLPDHLGSNRDVTDNTGAVVDHLVFTVFGGIVSESSLATADPMKFAGMYWEANSGLYHTLHRDVNPLTFQWTSEDPTYLNAGDANVRRYVANNPTNATDPSGLTKLDVPLDAINDLGIPAKRLRLDISNPDSFGEGEIQTVVNVSAGLYESLYQAKRDVGQLLKDYGMYMMTRFPKGASSYEENKLLPKWKESLAGKDKKLLKGIEKWFGDLSDAHQLVEINRVIEKCYEYTVTERVTYERVNDSDYVAYAHWRPWGGYFSLHDPCFKDTDLHNQVGVMVHEFVHFAAHTSLDYMLKDGKDPTKGYWDARKNAEDVTPSQAELRRNPDTYKGFMMDMYIPN